MDLRVATDLSAGRIALFSRAGAEVSHGRRIRQVRRSVDPKSASGIVNAIFDFNLNAPRAVNMYQECFLMPSTVYQIMYLGAIEARYARSAQSVEETGGSSKESRVPKP